MIGWLGKDRRIDGIVIEDYLDIDSCKTGDGLNDGIV